MSDKLAFKLAACESEHNYSTTVGMKLS